MEVWLIAAGLLVTIAGHVLTHTRSKGYTDRRLEEYDKQAAIFWKHINDRKIHEASMDAKLIESKFKNVDQKIDALKEDVRAVQVTVTGLKNDMPEMLLRTLKLYGKEKS